MTEANYTLVEKLSTWAQERGHTINELAHAWLMARPQVVSVISGATKVAQVMDNAKAGDWLLEVDELVEVTAILETA